MKIRFEKKGFLQSLTKSCCEYNKKTEKEHGIVERLVDTRIVKSYIGRNGRFPEKKNNMTCGGLERSD